MSVNRSLINRSAGAVEFGSTTLYPETEIGMDYAPDFDDVVAWAYGRVDECKKDFKIPIKMRLWGAYENLSVLFPAAVMSPDIGASLCSDAPLVVWGKNGNKVTFHNTFISKLADLQFGVDKNVWAADVEFMALIKSSANPEDASAYFTRASASFSPTVAFAKTNFLRRRATLAWALKTGFTSFEMREGVKIGWKLDVQYDYSGNYGTDNAYLGEKGLIAELSGIPAVTGANLSNSDARVRGQGTNLGTLAGDDAADLTCSLAGSGSHAVVLKSAFLAKFSELFDIKKLRPGEHVWRTVTGLTDGEPDEVGSVA